jgi:hypothetical protein
LEAAWVESMGRNPLVQRRPICQIEKGASRKDRKNAYTEKTRSEVVAEGGISRYRSTTLR